MYAINFLLLVAVIIKTVLSFDVGLVASELRNAIRGRVYLKGSPAYEKFRAVHNGGCNHIYPALIARPLDTKDVSEIVRISISHNAAISVRSGGHSYQCQGTKQNSINIDLRRLRAAKVISPYEAVLGPGNTWGQVLKVINPERFTMIHGQCLDVGVGGFLLGLGTNLPGTSSRYGTGADHVLEHTLVLVDASIAKVTPYNTTILGHYDQSPTGKKNFFTSHAFNRCRSTDKYDFLA